MEGEGVITILFENKRVIVLKNNSYGSLRKLSSRRPPGHRLLQKILTFIKLVWELYISEMFLSWYKVS